MIKPIPLREARKRAGLTQVELSRVSGIPQDHISKLEIGVIREPSFATVLRLANALRIDPRLLRFGSVDQAVA